VPSTPSLPSARAEAERPTGRREYESFEWYEVLRGVAQGTVAFNEVGTFSGRPDSIIIEVITASVEIRFRNRGEAPGSVALFTTAGVREFHVSAEIVEMRDPGFGGGQVVLAIGRYASRAIERRQSRRGPLLTDVRPREQGAPEQLEPR